MLTTTNGIILKNLELEDKRRLTILTEDLGVVEAWANGTRRSKSRLLASTELLSYDQLVLFQSRRSCTVDKAESLRVFFGIRAELDKLSLASYFAELTAELAVRGEPAGTYLRLLLNTLHLLEKDARPPLQLKALYELRLLTLAGYMPNLVACRSCARYEAERMIFFPLEGSLCCGDCLDSAPGGVPLSPGVLAAMRHIVYSEPDRLFSFALADEGLRLLSRVTEQYLTCQVEKSFPTLSFYHSIRSGSGAQ